jgi:hypothetical protein
MGKLHVKPASIIQVKHLLDLGFRDYVAARCLLRNRLYLQGATLASTSIEKYLKAYLAAHAGIQMNLHLRVEDLPKFRALFLTHKLDLLSTMDSAFVEILCQAFTLRYYDNDEERVIGFHAVQLLAELDEFVERAETELQLQNASGGKIVSDYLSARRRNDPEVCDDNFVVAGIVKKEIMERPGDFFAYVMRPNWMFMLQPVIKGLMRPGEYKGKMMSVTAIEIEDKLMMIKLNQDAVPFTVEQAAAAELSS